ncbi:unnamed protein product, partial [Rhizoctonia solani]
MQSASPLRVGAMILLLLYFCLAPVPVSGQSTADPTSEPPVPESSTRNDPPPEATSISTLPPVQPNPDLTITSRTIEQTETTGSATEIPPTRTVITSSYPIPDITETSVTTTWMPTTAIAPTATGATCPQKCLAQAADNIGCRGASDMSCLCPSLEKYISDANACMRIQDCESSQASQDVRTACSRNPPSPTTKKTVTKTQTQTFALTSGQVVTFGVSGTVVTTFTASSALTTTRIATILQQDGGSGGGDQEVGVGGGDVGQGSGNGAF